MVIRIASDLGTEGRGNGFKRATIGFGGEGAPTRYICLRSDNNALLPEHRTTDVGETYGMFIALRNKLREIEDNPPSPEEKILIYITNDNEKAVKSFNYLINEIRKRGQILFSGDEYDILRHVSSFRDCKPIKNKLIKHLPDIVSGKIEIKGIWRENKKAHRNAQIAKAYL